MSVERARSFGSVAELYDEFRPPPPPSAATLLGDLQGLKVLEVGAGTGLWSRYLVELGAELTIVEPDDDMRAVLQRRSPDLHALVGTAESLPVDDASYDVVVSSSAWHWFTQPDARNEMARVLVDRGRLFVLWNGFSREVEWVQELINLRNNEKGAVVRPRGWTAGELADGPFEDVTDISLSWSWPRTTEQMASLFGTYSGVIMLSDEQKVVVDQKVRARLAGMAVDGIIDVPMTLRGTTAVRSAR
jgi:SAM-dependent methyltransferase